MYLGEITRNVLLSFIDFAPPILFKGRSTPILNGHYGFDSAYMSDIEAAESLEDIRTVLVKKLEFSPEDVTDQDAEIVRWACRVVATRAAKLSACAVAAVLVQTERATLGGGKSSDVERFSVGVDGRLVPRYIHSSHDRCLYEEKRSLIQFYPNFEPRLRESLRLLIGEEVERRVDIGLAKDGSGVGGELWSRSSCHRT